MSKATIICAVAGLALGFIITYYTHLLDPAITWVKTAIMPHVTNFFAVVTNNPLVSTILTGMGGAAAATVVDNVRTAQKTTAVANVKTQAQTQISGLSNQLFQANTGQTEAEKKIQTLQQQVVDLKAQVAAGSDNTALLEAQQVIAQKNQQIERLQSDYNAVIRVKAATEDLVKTVVK